MLAGTVDLAYLDPPFFTQRQHVGRRGAFTDRWDDLAAYLGFMRTCLVALRRALKPSGSLYLHCDDHAAAELRILCDEVFGTGWFQNCIAWKRSSGSNSARRSFGRCHDSLLFYAGPGHTWNPPPEDVGDLWLDIPPINSWARERTGWPTQKPEALLERIVLASSNPGDLVLDAMCGSGTALVVAERHGRRWVGVDSSADALRVARERLAAVQPDPDRHGRASVACR